MIFSEIITSNVNMALAESGSSSGWLVDLIKDAIKKLGNWIIKGLVYTLSPFVIWGCKIIIVWCIVIYFLNQDSKQISTGMKVFLIYIIFLMIRGAVL